MNICEEMGFYLTVTVQSGFRPQHSTLSLTAITNMSLIIFIIIYMDKGEITGALPHQCGTDLYIL